MSDEKRKYRSAGWFGKMDRDGFGHRSWMRTRVSPTVFRWAARHRNLQYVVGAYAMQRAFSRIAEHVKRGVWEAGGLPLEFPVMSLGETNLRPTAMLFRNLVSMDVEESIRANPIDGVVLLCGCDKTTPSLVMGAASCDVPALVVSGGPMLNGKYCGQDIGSGTDVWRFSEDVKAGKMTLEEFHAGRDLHVAFGGSLHDHGNGLNDGLDGRGARLGMPHNAAIPAVGFAAVRPRASGRTPNRRDGA